MIGRHLGNLRDKNMFQFDAVLCAVQNRGMTLKHRTHPCILPESHLSRNESISDVSSYVLIKASSPNDKQTKHGAEELGLPLHNIILVIL